MSTAFDISKLTKTEKLRAMEELWQDLSQSDEEYSSPDWHKEILQNREKAVLAGTDEFIPWEDAKQRLRERSK